MLTTFQFLTISPLFGKFALPVMMKIRDTASFQMFSWEYNLYWDYIHWKFGKSYFKGTNWLVEKAQLIIILFFYYILKQ